MEKRNKIIIEISLPFIFSLTGILMLYYFFTEQIIITFQTYKEIYALTIAILIKILVVSLIGLYLIKKWFSQEEQYFSDLPFLTGIFFLVLVPAKFLDLLYYYLNFQIPADFLLLLIKMRFILAILNLLPMLYLSIEMILIYLSLNERFKSIRNKNKFKKIQKLCLILILIIESIVLLIAPSYNVIIAIYPFISVISFLIIIWMFIFAHRSNRLSEINPITVAWGFIIFLITSIFRALGTNLLDPVLNSIITEIFEIGAFIVIFYGLIKRAKYYKTNNRMG
ncbi:MAG: conserved membrane protein of unknown function [Promethearchaeota archaeon]|nr:MAG: conserved membrane protein of unknown function [Candidatus Lokiarchaeota archaeon]